PGPVPLLRPRRDRAGARPILDRRAAVSARRMLVAGVGNIFLSDDGFGSEVVRRMQGVPVPADVDVIDVGIRGVHLAYQLLDGYDVLVVIDAAARGQAPGTVTLLT